MEALILSCGTGGGHNAAARAIQQELTARGHSAQLLNPYSLRGRHVESAVNAAYVKLVQTAPHVFGVVYSLGNAYRRVPFRSPVYYVNGRMAAYLGRYLSEHRFDVIVSTHIFPAEILTSLRHRGFPLPKIYYIATDYTCIPFTEETECDGYIIPSEKLIPEFCRRGIPRERLYPLGIPVREQFYQHADRAELREVLGLDPDKQYILLAGGSIGAGKIGQAVSALLSHYDRESVELIVICGNNQKLYRGLSRRCGGKCTVLGSTPDMDKYMRACDLFISKPGGLSSTEAVVSGASLIHITPIPGCETRNMRFFQHYGLGVAVPFLWPKLLKVCDEMLARERANDRNSGDGRVIPAHATAAICDLIERDRERLAVQAGAEDTGVAAAMG